MPSEQRWNYADYFRAQEARIAGARQHRARCLNEEAIDVVDASVEETNDGYDVIPVEGLSD